jgi:hypothetical protein
VGALAWNAGVLVLLQWFGRQLTCFSSQMQWRFDLQTVYWYEYGRAAAWFMCNGRPGASVQAA